MPSHYHQPGGLLSPSAFPVPFDPRDPASRNPYDQLKGFVTRKASEVADDPTSALLGTALQDPLMLADLSGATSPGRVKRESAGYGSLLGEPPIEVQGLPAGDISRQQLGIDNPAGMTGEMSPLSIGGMLKLAGKGLLSGGKAALGALGDGGGLLAHTLFHGTPHKFDRFALDKIGTGEGAQAYGHGLYFAENPGVAKSYAPRDFDAEEVMMQRYKAAESVEDYESMEVWERAMMHDTADEIREIYRDTDYGAAMRDKAEAIASEVEQLAQQGTKGHLYEVDIPDEITDRMLDWDAPLSEQPESVQRALRELGVELPPGEMGSEVLDVDNKRRVLGRAGPGSEEAMSAALNEAGIPGIRYFDGDSRTAGEGTRNIVVFNPDDITSVKRDGELVWENRSGIRPD